MDKSDDVLRLSGRMKEVDRNELLDCPDRPNRSPYLGNELPMQSAIQPPTVTEPVKVDTKVEVMNKLKRASTQLMECQHIAAQANAMASDLPVFKEMTLISKRLNEMMLEVSRLRGL